MSLHTYTSSVILPDMDKNTHKDFVLCQLMTLPKVIKTEQSQDIQQDQPSTQVQNDASKRLTQYEGDNPAINVSKACIQYRTKMHNTLKMINNSMSTMLQESFNGIDTICNKVRNCLSDMENHNIHIKYNKTMKSSDDMCSTPQEATDNNNNKNDNNFPNFDEGATDKTATERDPDSLQFEEENPIASDNDLSIFDALSDSDENETRGGGKFKQNRAAIGDKKNKNKMPTFLVNYKRTRCKPKLKKIRLTKKRPGSLSKILEITDRINSLCDNLDYSDLNTSIDRDLRMFQENIRSLKDMVQKTDSVDLIKSKSHLQSSLMRVSSVLEKVKEKKSNSGCSYVTVENVLSPFRKGINQSHDEYQYYDSSTSEESDSDDCTSSTYIISENTVNRTNNSAKVLESCGRTLGKLDISSTDFDSLHKISSMLNKIDEESRLKADQSEKQLHEFSTIGPVLEVVKSSNDMDNRLDSSCNNTYEMHSKYIVPRKILCESRKGVTIYEDFVGSSPNVKREKKVVYLHKKKFNFSKLIDPLMYKHNRNSEFNLPNNNNQQLISLQPDIYRKKGFSNLHRRMMYQLQANDSLEGFLALMNRQKLYVDDEKDLSDASHNKKERNFPLQNILRCKTPISHQSKIRPKFLYQDFSKYQSKKNLKNRTKLKGFASKKLHQSNDNFAKKYIDSLWFSPKFKANKNLVNKICKTVTISERPVTPRPITAKSLTGKEVCMCNLTVQNLAPVAYSPDTCKIHWMRAKVHHTVRQRRALRVCNILDDLSMKDIAPFKSEYPRRDDFVPDTGFKKVQDTYLYNLLYGKNSLTDAWENLMSYKNTTTKSNRSKNQKKKIKLTSETHSVEDKGDAAPQNEVVCQKVELGQKPKKKNKSNYKSAERKEIKKASGNTKLVDSEKGEPVECPKKVGKKNSCSAKLAELEKGELTEGFKKDGKKISAPEQAEFASKKVGKRISASAKLVECEKAEQKIVKRSSCGTRLQESDKGEPAEHTKKAVKKNLPSAKWVDTEKCECTKKQAKKTVGKIKYLEPENSELVVQAKKLCKRNSCSKKRTDFENKADKLPIPAPQNSPASPGEAPLKATKNSAILGNLPKSVSNFKVNSKPNVLHKGRKTTPGVSNNLSGHNSANAVSTTPTYPKITQLNNLPTSDLPVAGPQINLDPPPDGMPSNLNKTWVLQKLSPYLQDPQPEYFRSVTVLPVKVFYDNFGPHIERGTYTHFNNVHPSLIEDVSTDSFSSESNYLRDSTDELSNIKTEQIPRVFITNLTNVLPPRKSKQRAGNKSFITDLTAERKASSDLNKKKSAFVVRNNLLKKPRQCSDFDRRRPLYSPKPTKVNLTPSNRFDLKKNSSNLDPAKKSVHSARMELREKQDDAKTSNNKNKKKKFCEKKSSRAIVDDKLRQATILTQLESLKMRNDLIQENIQKAIKVIESKIVDILSAPDNHSNGDAFGEMEKEVTFVLNMMKHRKASKSKLLKNNPDNASKEIEISTIQLVPEKEKTIKETVESTGPIENFETKKTRPKSTRKRLTYNISTSKLFSKLQNILDAEMESADSETNSLLNQFTKAKTCLDIISANKNKKLSRHYEQLVENSDPEHERCMITMAQQPKGSNPIVISNKIIESKITKGDRESVAEKCVEKLEDNKEVNSREGGFRTDDEANFIKDKGNETDASIEEILKPQYLETNEKSLLTEKVKTTEKRCESVLLNAKSTEYSASSVEFDKQIDKVIEQVDDICTKLADVGQISPAFSSHKIKNSEVSSKTFLTPFMSAIKNLRNRPEIAENFFEAPAELDSSHCSIINFLDSLASVVEEPPKQVHLAQAVHLTIEIYFAEVFIVVQKFEQVKLVDAIGVDEKGDKALDSGNSVEYSHETDEEIYNKPKKPRMNLKLKTNLSTHELKQNYEKVKSLYASASIRTTKSSDYLLDVVKNSCPRNCTNENENESGSTKGVKKLDKKVKRIVCEFVKEIEVEDGIDTNDMHVKLLKSFYTAFFTLVFIALAFDYSC